MSSKLHVIALISGGKDSLFSLLHCLKNDHDVVALANLHPPPPEHASGLDDDNGEGQDLDSFMYQTVGHSIIPLYEHALQLPLYRQPIQGQAVNTDRDYHTEEQDETESLVPLLRKVLAAHPNANAVCTGAILSTYQRTRVESVCHRLALVPLGYLWQYPHLPPYQDAQLLRDMAAVNQDARIIKVASGGLDDAFLWLNVAHPPTVLRLRRAAARFGGEGAVLGEGGEFETVAVDGPACVWKGGRIEVDVGEEGVAGEGGSAVVRFRGARVVEKAEDDGEGHGLEKLRVPDLLDVEFEELGRTLLSLSAETTTTTTTPPDTLSTSPPLPPLHPHTTLHGTTLTISNLTAPTAPSPSAQLNAITTHLGTLLAQHNASPQHITSTTLLLRSMSLFTPLNPLYGALFTAAPTPPARITMACGSALPPGVDVALSCSVHLPASAHHKRRGIHVQSRSYWAPANIGPYSQAVAVPAVCSSSSPPAGGDDEGEVEVELVHLAGQIPLVPASMEMVRAADLPFPDADEFGAQALLALQHLWRVGRVMGVRWWGCGVAFLASPSGAGEGASGGRRARVVREAWMGVHVGMRPEGNNEEEEEEGEGVDVWDLKFGNAGRGGGGALAEEGDARAKLPDFEGVRWKTGGEEEGVLAPPCIVAQVSELPRAADVEWTSPGLARATGGVLDVVLGVLRGGETGLAVHETKAAGGAVCFYAAGLAGADEVWEWEDVLKGAGVPVEGRVCTVYVAKPLPQEWLEAAKPLVVPCARVWGPDGREVAAAVTVRHCGGGDAR